jgi:nucleoside-diphosphate-sugar epimerase
MVRPAILVRCSIPIYGPLIPHILRFNVLQGMANCLKAAAREKSVKHVVYTSSIGAAVDIPLLPDVGRVFTDADWNPCTYDQAIDPDLAFFPSFQYCG